MTENSQNCITFTDSYCYSYAISSLLPSHAKEGLPLINTPLYCIAILIYCTLCYSAFFSFSYISILSYCALVQLQDSTIHPFKSSQPFQKLAYGSKPYFSPDSFLFSISLLLASSSPLPVVQSSYSFIPFQIHSSLCHCQQLPVPYFQIQYYIHSYLCFYLLWCSTTFHLPCFPALLSDSTLHINDFYLIKCFYRSEFSNLHH